MPEPDLYHFHIPYKELEISPRAISRTIGYQDDAVPALVQEIIEEVLNKAETHTNLQGGYRLIKEISLDKNSVTLKDIKFSTDKIIGSRLKEAETIAVFVCTAGMAYQQWLEEDDTLKNYIIDLAGSEIVESAMDWLQNLLEKEMKKRGKGITNRYSPGYCNWNVTEQHLLFSLLPEKFCNITLTEHAFMLPKKSVSGFIGIGKNSQKINYDCHACDINGCIIRNKR